MSQHANIFDPQIENTDCVFLENKFQQRELRFLLRKVILVERRNTTFRATITIWFILAKVSIFHGSSPYTQDAETGQVVAFWIVHKDQVKSDIEVCLQSNCTHKVGSSPAMEPCGAKTSLGVSFKPLSLSSWGPGDPNGDPLGSSALEFNFFQVAWRERKSLWMCSLQIAQFLSGVFWPLALVYGDLQ